MFHFPLMFCQEQLFAPTLNRHSWIAITSNQELFFKLCKYSATVACVIVFLFMNRKLPGDKCSASVSLSYLLLQYLSQRRNMIACLWNICRSWRLVMFTLMTHANTVGANLKYSHSFSWIYLFHFCCLIIFITVIMCIYQKLYKYSDLLSSFSEIMWEYDPIWSQILHCMNQLLYHQH